MTLPAMAPRAAIVVSRLLWSVSFPFGLRILLYKRLHGNARAACQDPFRTDEDGSSRTLPNTLNGEAFPPPHSLAGRFLSGCGRCSAPDPGSDSCSGWCSARGSSSPSWSKPPFACSAMAVVFPCMEKLYTAGKRRCSGAALPLKNFPGNCTSLLDKQSAEWYHTSAKQRRAAASVLTPSSGKGVND